MTSFPLHPLSLLWNFFVFWDAITKYFFFTARLSWAREAPPTQHLEPAPHRN